MTKVQRTPTTAKKLFVFHFWKHSFTFPVCCRTHRGDRGRGEKEGVSLPSQLEHTPQLGSWWLMVMETKVLFSLLWYIQCYLILYLKLIFNSCLGMALAALHTTEVLNRVLIWLGDWHQKMWRTKAAAVDISLPLSIFAQTQGMTSRFKLPSQWKHAPPHLSSSSSGGDGNQGSSLAFRQMYILYYHSQCTLISPSKVKRRKKGTVSAVYWNTSSLVVLWK